MKLGSGAAGSDCGGDDNGDGGYGGDGVDEGRGGVRVQNDFSFNRRWMSRQSFRLSVHRIGSTRGNYTFRS